MKRLLISLLLLISVCAFAQDSTVTFNNAGYYSTNLKSTADGAGYDSCDVVCGGFLSGRFNYVTITATSTVADTIIVSTLSANQSTWARVALKDMRNDSTVTQIAIGTTPIMFKVIDPQPHKLRLEATDLDSINITVVIEGKYQR